MNWNFLESWILNRAREKESREWHERIQREGVNPSYKPPSKIVIRLTCPKCNSDKIKPAGYADRFECEACGNIFI